ncbi:DUF5073 domain-containing protein [Nocardia sp. SYP-A9097]|uniref:DUF5073 family protein n=1 Tax=Nocardia sp. SYP-A9097 TaxID=2663237 RepID=UPI00129B72E2|nr:DUF5073 family protein [Nocardia sp. SYP-A9097]MRH88186.1 DUF5073 domain-containing protein [Nocardia sp. SYP-A9097]
MTFDSDRAAQVIAAALHGPGGVGLVFNVFGSVPGAVRTPAKSGLFRSEPERLQLGSWRYEVTGDQRIRAAHVVNGIVLAEEVLTAAAVGPHVARALSDLVEGFGTPALPQIAAALEVLETVG